jgi:hypothetical protein
MTDTDLRTAAAAFEAILSEYCDGPLRDALRAALAQSDGPLPPLPQDATLPWNRDEATPAPTADKCPNPDCEDGQIHMYADQIIDCPTCHGTGEKP